jgi:hypothetical protein
VPRQTCLSYQNSLPCQQGGTTGSPRAIPNTQDGTYTEQMLDKYVMTGWMSIALLEDGEFGLQPERCPGALHTWGLCR